MARRFNGSTDALSITAGLPGFPCTLMGWFMVSVDGNQFHNFLSYGDSAAGGFYCEVGANFSGANSYLYIWDGGDEASGSNLAVGAWNHIAIVMQPPTDAQDDALAYLNGVLDITNVNIHDSVSSEKLWVGNDSDSGFMNGSAAAIKIWAAQLTADEIAHESRFYTPQRFTNLNRWSPLLTDEVELFSSTAWTVGGTLTTEDGPPILWAPRGGRRRIFTFTEAVPSFTEEVFFQQPPPVALPVVAIPY